MTETRPLNLKMLDAHDMADNVKNLVEAVMMAKSDIDDTRQRRALDSLLFITLEKVADLIQHIEDMRGEMK